MHEELRIPDFGLVVLIGASGSGKSTFAAKHFRPSEVLSSDRYREVVGDDDRGPETTKDAFHVIETIAERRLRRRRIAVIDATNIQPDDRKRYVHLARREHAPLTAIALELPEKVCHRQNLARGDEARPPHVVRRHVQGMRRHARTLSREGFRRRHRLRSAEEAASVTVTRVPTATDLRDRKGPFDIIGDIHGCRAELVELLGQLGYRIERKAGDEWPHYEVAAPEGRTAILLGDLVDRGPESVETLALAMDGTESGAFLAIPGNHDAKLGRALRGAKVERRHGLAETMAALEAAPEAFRERVADWIGKLPSHYVLDGGALVAAHAGMKEELQNRSSREVREFGLYGETTGENDEDGLPVRIDWARDYRGRAAVIYGHTPVAEPDWVNNTLCIDTGCAFGGRLTALRWPEREIVSVAARRTYHEPPKALREAEETNRQQASDRLLSIEDVRTPSRIQTALAGSVSIRRENGAAALETMSRFGVDPRWMIYLPPTMSPCDTTTKEGMLEHPAEAFGYFRARDVRKVMCEEKHMGSRAIVICGRTPAEAERRFGIASPAGGTIYSRTGRRFFDDTGVETELLEEIRGAMETAGLWKELETDWIALDAEIMPWSAKGAGLIQDHYQPVAAASRMAFEAAADALEAAERGGADVAALRERFEYRSRLTALYEAAYRRYNWKVEGTKGLKVAPFHVLATEGRHHLRQGHDWQMDVLGRLTTNGATLTATEHRTVDVDDAGEVAECTRWWEQRTTAGAEGMVVKPLEGVVTTSRGTVQPALKVRGREYLRIIYGPEYTTPWQIGQLRRRNTGGKRRLALREFALGVEALAAFVGRSPLRKVHRAVFGVLALESEPIDPRL